MTSVVASWQPADARAHCAAPAPADCPALRRVAQLEAEVVQLQAEGQSLREENIRLRQQAHFYQAQHARALEREQALEQIVSALKGKVGELHQRLYGRKSEQPHSGQSWAAQRRERRGRGQRAGAPGHGRQRHPDLPVERVLVSLPADQTQCPQCGLPYVLDGTVAGGEEIVVEVRIQRRQRRRQRYQPSCGCPRVGLPARVVAPPPPQVIAKGILSVESIVEVVLWKYQQHLPLQRISRYLGGLGLRLACGTMCGILAALVPLVKPLYGALVRACQEDPQWLMDETRLEVFEEVEGKGSFRWWMWVVVSVRVRVYVLSPSRGQAVPKAFFGYDPASGQCRRGGSLMADRFASYKFLRAWLRLIFCWVHVRRDFLLARAGAEAEQVAWADGWVERIGQLYHLTEARLELGRDLKGPGLPPPFVRLDPVRQASPEYQQAEARLRQAVTGMATQREAELAQPCLPRVRRKILESLREHWEGLTQFLDHPELPLDNNGAERGARPVALGRKNYYGCGSQWSGQLLAMLLTVLQTLALYPMIDVRAYLCAYLQSCAQNGGQAPADLEPWLPWNFARRAAEPKGGHPP